jgi:hypothetical protein
LDSEGCYQQFRASYIGYPPFVSKYTPS